MGGLGAVDVGDAFAFPMVSVGICAPVVFLYYQEEWQKQFCGCASSPCRRPSRESSMLAAETWEFLIYTRIHLAELISITCLDAGELCLFCPGSFAASGILPGYPLHLERVRSLAAFPPCAGGAGLPGSRPGVAVAGALASPPDHLLQFCLPSQVLPWLGFILIKAQLGVLSLLLLKRDNRSYNFILTPLVLYPTK